jgi:hypothetical protein
MSTQFTYGAFGDILETGKLAWRIIEILRGKDAFAANKQLVFSLTSIVKDTDTLKHLPVIDTLTAVCKSNDTIRK